MLYLLDEGWPPDFARLLNQQFCPEHSSPVVQHIRDLISLGVDDSDWMTQLEQRVQIHNEQWTVITRDKMKIHRVAMSASPIKFAILVDLRWANARKPELWRTICQYWPRLQQHAETSSANVFRLSDSGEISD